ncbi:hypothetical protein Tco_1553896 [Tanacetum coccineum]
MCLGLRMISRLSLKNDMPLRDKVEADESNDPDDIAKIFKIKGNLFDYEKPLCKEFNEFNYLLKIDTDLFTFDIQGIKTYEGNELNNNMTGDLEEPWMQYGVSLGLRYDDLVVKKSTIWYTLRKTCIELVRAFLGLVNTLFAQELKLENHPEQHIRGVPRSNSISHFL